MCGEPISDDNNAWECEEELDDVGILFFYFQRISQDILKLFQLSSLISFDDL
jgi:hypothetical protein